MGREMRRPLAKVFRKEDDLRDPSAFWNSRVPLGPLSFEMSRVFDCRVPVVDSPVGRQRCPVHPASSLGAVYRAYVRVHFKPVAGGCGHLLVSGF